MSDGGQWRASVCRPDEADRAAQELLRQAVALLATRGDMGGALGAATRLAAEAALDLAEALCGAAGDGPVRQARMQEAYHSVRAASTAARLAVVEAEDRMRQRAVGGEPPAAGAVSGAAVAT